MIYFIFSLSCENGEFGASLNYLVVRDFCKKEKLDVIEIYSILKEILGAIK